MACWWGRGPFENTRGAGAAPLQPPTDRSGRTCATAASPRRRSSLEQQQRGQATTSPGRPSPELFSRSPPRAHHLETCRAGPRGRATPCRSSRCPRLKRRATRVWASLRAAIMTGSTRRRLRCGGVAGARALQAARRCSCGCAAVSQRPAGVK